MCAVFCGRRRIAFLNTTPDEVIRSIFFNKHNQSIITVSVYRADNFSSLKCRTTPIEYLRWGPASKYGHGMCSRRCRSLDVLSSHHPSRRGKPDAGFALFEGECLKWPGFVEFDDVNGKVLAFPYYDLTSYGYTY